MASFRLAGLLRRCVRPAVRATLVTATAYTLMEWDLGGATVALLERSNRSSALPAEFVRLAHTPAVPYPGWDADWDGLTLPAKAVAKDLGHSWPIADYAAAIRTLFVEHYAFSATSRYRSLAEVERAIERRREKGEGELEEFYREAYMRHAWGGAPVKHVILVRHGQYEERHDLERRLQAAVGGQQFELDERQQRGAYLTLDRQRVLTPLGRRQAEATGDRLAALLKPALTTEGREADVRVHCSTLARAKETADLIATRLAPHVVRLPPDPLLSEGNPAPDMPGCWFADAPSILVEGARIEAGFRALFHRAVPRKPQQPDRQPPPPPPPPPTSSSPSAAAAAIAASAATTTSSSSSSGESEAPAPLLCSTAASSSAAAGGPWEDKQRHEYEVVVCHMNVIRYFFLRALQLPPEAWLRCGGHNGSMTILKVDPASGRVGLRCFGDFGHLTLEETTFGRHQGIE